MEKNKVFTSTCKETMSIYGLRSSPLGHTSYFRSVLDCRPGDYVLIQTDHGLSIAKVNSGPLAALPGSNEEDLPEVIRRASDEDMDVYLKNRDLAAAAMAFCKLCIKERGLEMKLVDVEVFFDRSKLIFYFTAPGRIDFRDLVKDLVREYHSRIELRQIGVRHETSMLGACGNCGMVCCCRGYLRKFAPVTIKMAKEQNLFLNPAKISGICGRLLCCLAYEQENYEQFHREAPRPGKKYQTNRGMVKILRVNMFKNSVSALLENNEETEITLDEWHSLKPARPEHDSFMEETQDNGDMKDLDYEGY